jgi:hypothetical protein
MVQFFSRSMMLGAALFFAAGTLVIDSRAANAGDEVVSSDCACESGNCQNCRRGRHGQRGGDVGVSHPYGSYRPALSQNYYGPSTYAGGQPVQMYLSPVPTPPAVGHTYYTYQPLMPHESMYPHRSSYHRAYDNGRGLNRTTVHWHRSPVYSGGSRVIRHFRIAR